MNYYPHHIGDFNNATRHLNRVERSIYRDLLEIYYDTEAMLTLDFQELCRKVLARTPEEATAVEQVLNEYFNRTSTGFHHGRCEAEIARFKGNTSAKSIAGKASAAKRKAIKTPPQPAPLTDKATAVEQTLNRCATNQEPITIKSTALSGKPDESSVSHKSEAVEILEFLNTKTGRGYRPVKANIEMIIARLKEGATVADCRQVIAKKTREWGTDEKMEQYLRPKTIFNRTNFANYVGELGNG